MQLAWLIATTLLATAVVANAEDSDDAFSIKELEKRYEVIQRQREELKKAPGQITTKVEYFHHHKSQRLPSDKVQDISNSYIECVQGQLDSNLIYDFPMPVGWLYPSFGEGGETTKKFFDTEVREHWAFPNFSCNFKNVLTAVSWMRSGKNSGGLKNKAMHSKFRDHKPDFYDGKKYFDHRRSGGVYCNWDGWLYPSSSLHYKYFIETDGDNELFTLLNVYCHKHSYVREFYSAAASADQAMENNKKPFHNIRPKSQIGDSEYPSVRCNWDGWLYGDMSGEHWHDGDNKRYGYEKYFAVERHPIGHNKQIWMRGRVANPFCSKSGIVTAVRAFCFFAIRSYTEDNIKSLHQRHCSGL